MNYSKNLNKTAVAKRVIVSWVIVAVVGLSVGGVSGYTLQTHISTKDEPDEETQAIEQVEEEPLVFGAYDDHIFTEEVPLDWMAGDLDFTPLDVPMDAGEQEFTFYLSKAYNIDFTLVMALMRHESSFRSDVVSCTNDYGLMQINQCNHKHLTETLGVTDFLDPYQNIRAGMYTLRKLFERYQDTRMVLMAYNLGEGGAARLWKNGIFETDYTQSILAIQQQFQKELEGDADAGKLEGH